MDLKNLILEWRKECEKLSVELEQAEKDCKEQDRVYLSITDRYKAFNGPYFHNDSTEYARKHFTEKYEAVMKILDEYDAYVPQQARASKRRREAELAFDEAQKSYMQKREKLLSE